MTDYCKPTEFQTPTWVCHYMVSFVPDGSKHLLEPTPGEGNLVRALRLKGFEVTAPEDFFQIKNQRFDAIVMNPPFTPMKLGYEILYKCLEMSDNVIALMPWLTVINSTKRTKDLMNFGLVSVTHLPRNVFKGARVQTCVLQLQRGFQGESRFKSIEQHGETFLFH